MTINKAFIRLPKDDGDQPGKGAYWAINPENYDEFRDGIFTGKIRSAEYRSTPKSNATGRTVRRMRRSRSGATMSGGSSMMSSANSSTLSILDIGGVPGDFMLSNPFDTTLLGYQHLQQSSLPPLQQQQQPGSSIFPFSTPYHQQNFQTSTIPPPLSMSQPGTMNSGSQQMTFGPSISPMPTQFAPVSSQQAGNDEMGDYGFSGPPPSGSQVIQFGYMAPQSGAGSSSITSTVGSGNNVNNSNMVYGYPMNTGNHSATGYWPAPILSFRDQQLAPAMNCNCAYCTTLPAAPQSPNPEECGQPLLAPNHSMENTEKTEAEMDASKCVEGNESENVVIVSNDSSVSPQSQESSENPAGGVYGDYYNSTMDDAQVYGLSAAAPTEQDQQ